MSAELPPLSVPAAVLAFLEGTRTAMFYMLLTLAASFGSAVLAMRPRPAVDPVSEPLWRVVLLAGGLWLLALGAAGGFAALFEAWPRLALLPPLLGPVTFVALLAAWRLGEVARVTRAFATAPEVAHRLALDAAPARRRLLLLFSGAVVGAGLYAASVPATELVIAVLVATGFAAMLHGRPVEATAAITFTLVAAVSAIATAADLPQPVTVSAAAVVLACLWTARRRRRVPGLA